METHKRMWPRRLAKLTIVLAVLFAIWWIAFEADAAEASPTCPVGQVGGVGPDAFGSATFRCITPNPTFWLTEVGDAQVTTLIDVPVSATVAGWSNALASASGSRCRYVKHHIALRAKRTHWVLFNMDMSRYICRNQQIVTYAPTASYDIKPTGAADFGGWSVKGIITKQSYWEQHDGRLHAAHVKLVRWKVERKICSPIDLPFLPDCIKQEERHPSIWIRVLGLSYSPNIWRGGAWG